jgi:hypothetical protein
MRGVTSIAVGAGLLAVAIGMAAYGASLTTVLIFGAGALVLFYRGFQGQGVGTVEDVTAPMDFISNPAGAIVDAATDKVGEMLMEARRPAEPKEPPAFDADAALARYLANRPAPAPSSSAADPAPARRQFGRKGL